MTACARARPSIRGRPTAWVAAFIATPPRHQDQAAPSVVLITATICRLRANNASLQRHRPRPPIWRPLNLVLVMDCCRGSILRRVDLAGFDCFRRDSRFMSCGSRPRSQATRRTLIGRGLARFEAVSADIIGV